MPSDNSQVFDLVAPARREVLRALVEEVLRVNQQFNLTAVRDFDGAWVKHIEDSLQALPTDLLEGRKSLVDVGAGAGFPGLALAAARPELRVKLLDSTRKKCDFIDGAAKLLELNARAQCGRVEEFGQNPVWRERFDIATVRAVGGFSEVCELALPLVKIGGHLLLWRGALAREEIETGARALKELGADSAAIGVHPYQLAGHDTPYHLLVIPKKRATPRMYPRRVGVPKSQPL